MHTKRFLENVIKGQEAEEQTAQWYEKQGYRVERVGSYKLPIDLLVWNDKEEFGVQVKYRNIGNIGHNMFRYLRDKEFLSLQRITREDKLKIVILVTNGKERQTSELYVPHML